MYIGTKLKVPETVKVRSNYGKNEGIVVGFGIDYLDVWDNLSDRVKHRLRFNTIEELEQSLNLRET